MTTLRYGQNTLELIQTLLKRGITRMSVMMRHSARHYDWDHPEKEPFLLLTEEGKEYAYQLGKSFPGDLTLRFFSSLVGRCIETAYLLDKGYVFQQGQTEHNQMEPFLSPSYVKKPHELVPIMQQQSPNFVRYWFEGNIPTDIIDPPQPAAREIVAMLIRKLDELPAKHLNIGVSHDWNLYLIKEQIMGLKHEEVGRVEYLEGLIIYREQGKAYVHNHQCEPVEIRSPLPPR